MNCSEAKNISIREVLESFSLFPSKENSRTAFYFALDREEKTPSLSVDFSKNTAFDFGTGKSYDSISIVQAMKKCSISDALKYLEQFNFYFQKQNLRVLQHTVCVLSQSRCQQDLTKSSNPSDCSHLTKYFWLLCLLCPYDIFLCR